MNNLLVYIIEFIAQICIFLPFVNVLNFSNGMTYHKIYNILDEHYCSIEYEQYNKSTCRTLLPIMNALIILIFTQMAVHFSAVFVQLMINVYHQNRYRYVDVNTGQLQNDNCSNRKFTNKYIMVVFYLIVMVSMSLFSYIIRRLYSLDEQMDIDVGGYVAIAGYGLFILNLLQFLYRCIWIK